MSRSIPRFRGLAGIALALAVAGGAAAEAGGGPSAGAPAEHTWELAILAGRWLELGLGYDAEEAFARLREAARRARRDGIGCERLSPSRLRPEDAGGPLDDDRNRLTYRRDDGIRREPH